MKPNRIILIRHGESEGNLDNSLYKTTPDYALKLTQRGVSQAKQAGRFNETVI
jgi:broad specificity phosphatase PhoE